MKTSVLILFVLSLQLPLNACIWDSDTLSDEQRKSPDMAKAILSEPTSPDPVPLRDRIKKLQADPHENDAVWWNDLAGAHLRLGEAQEAATLLESVTNRFANDYGVHANLGTAYHLLGRYADAEREIARDLEINPDAHFGLEKYHLALLQYLIRDSKYQMRHVYVDEFSSSFPESRGPFFYLHEESEGTDTNSAVMLAELEQEYTSLPVGEEYRREQLQALMADLDERPSYRARWNLAKDTHFIHGVIYMATLNPKQPACFVMLGIASWKSRDLNLAASAFEKAIALGSPQSDILKRKAQELRAHISKAQSMERENYGALVAGFTLLTLGGLAVLWLIRKCMARLTATKRV